MEDMTRRCRKEKKRKEKIDLAEEEAEEECENDKETILSVYANSTPV
jgi:hypothetical protein